MTNNKYEILNESKSIQTHSGGEKETVILYRIKSLVDIRDDVPVGTLGGWVSSESNLSELGTCWIYDDAVCMQDALVEESATLRNNAIVYNHAKVYGQSSVKDNATVSGRAVVRGFSKVREFAKVEDNSVVEDRADICEMAKLQGDAFVTSNAVVGSTSRVKSYVSKNPISLTGSFYDLTMSDNELCYGCISLPFAKWTELATLTKEDFVALMANDLEQFTTTTGKFDSHHASKSYDLLIRSLGLVGRLAQIYGRDTMGFSYIDKGYTLSITAGTPDYRNQENKLDLMDFFE